MHLIESAALMSWPALETEPFKGWLLRFSLGYTGRANSVNATRDAAPLTERDVDDIESRYRGRGLAPRFRLTDFNLPVGVDETLAARGYELCDATWVMTAPLSEALALLGPGHGASAVASAAGAGSTVVPGDGFVTMPSAAAWLDTYQSLSGKWGLDQATHLQILELIQAPHVFAVGRDDAQRTVACGLGVVALEWLGLFDIVTSEARRREGHARALCSELIRRGAALGARGAYLQVVESNHAAVALYRQLGFKPAYRYWYRALP